MTDSDATRKMQFLYALRSRGVTDKRVLSAMEAIDRGPFVRGIFQIVPTRTCRCQSPAARPSANLPSWA